MGVAWLVTLPLAGLVGAFAYGVVHLFGGYPGAIIGFSLLCLVSAAIGVRARRVRVDHNNVNAEWEGSLTAGLDASAAELPDDAGLPGLGLDVESAVPAHTAR